MYFDKKAKDWDEDQQKVARATVFAKEIVDFIQPNNNLNAIDFGCGTGLLSSKLRDNFKTITLVDNSEGMISVLKKKIEDEGITNFIPLQIDLFDNSNKLPKTNVIYTMMALHHMVDISKTLQAFNSLIEPNGYLCIADLVSEDGSFHAQHDGFIGHNGFDKDELGGLLVENGFELVYYKECFVIEKEIEEIIIKYPLFLMIGKKNNSIK